MEEPERAGCVLPEPDTQLHLRRGVLGGPAPGQGRGLPGQCPVALFLYFVFCFLHQDFRLVSFVCALVFFSPSLPSSL